MTPFAPAQPDLSSARQARLRAMFEFSPLAISASDGRGYLVECNAAYERILGYTQDELRHMHFADLSTPEAVAENLRLFREMADGARDGYVVEKTYIRKDGTEIWVHVTATAVRSATGEFEYCVAMVEDITERRRLAQALRDSEERHRTLLESLPVIVYRADANAPFGTYYISPGIRILGRSVEEWLGTPSAWLDALHPDDRDRVLQQAELVKRERRPFDCEYRMVAADGTELWFHDQGDFIHDAAGTPIAWQGVMHDISERKRAELALRKNEDLFRSLTEHTAELLSTVSADGLFQYVSPSVVRILGWSQAELIGRSVADVVHQDDLATVSALLGQAVTETHDGRMIRVRIRHRDGRWRVMEGSATNLLDHPIVRGIMSNARDVTDQLAADDSLHLQAHLLDTVEQGVVALDSDRRIVYWNRHAERLLGWTADEAIGRLSHELFTDATGEDDGHVKRVIAGGASWSRERVLRRRDGTEFTASSTTSPLVNAAGEIEGVVGVFTDITAKQHLEEQLRQSQKMQAVGQLAGGIAHDFNNLLTVISGRAQFLRKATPGSADWIEDVDEVCTAAFRAAGLTRQLLAFSRKQMLQPKVLDLNDRVAELIPMLQRLIDEDIELVTHLAAGAQAINADPGQVDQVLVNLVVNAHHAMPQGGQVLIATRNETVMAGSKLSLNNEGAAGHYVVLSVKDSGVGMDAKTLSRVFEPFFTTKEPGQGTGLGLSTAYGIAKQSGGFITARSTPQVGSVFELFLPAANGAKLTPKSVEAVRPDWDGTETILLVEDAAAVRKLAELILRRRGYTVLSASNGFEAIELAAAHAGSIELLLTDVVMPRMGGREVADAVTAQRPDVRVLYMSGYTDDVIIRKGLAESEAAFMEKPFTPASLAQRVRQRLDT